MRDPDATVVLPRPRAIEPSAPAQAAPRPAAGRAAVIVAAGAAIVVGAAGAGAWYWLRSGPVEPPPKPEAPAVVHAPPAMPAEPAPPLADASAIYDYRATAPTVFRLASNPRVFVVDAPNLDVQGAMFNRVAALVEKAGQPRDRLLNDAELAAAIERSGDTPATYYYGHNYRGRDLERFFALADRDGIALNPFEQQLRREIRRVRELVPLPGQFAVISVPGLDPRVDGTMRRAILDHEIGHGEFFTNGAFAEHVAQVWRNVFTEQERAAFRAYLAREGYDPALEEVMMNEAMAYLAFTPDRRFFMPSHAGLTDARAAELRDALRAQAPR